MSNFVPMRRLKRPFLWQELLASFMKDDGSTVGKFLPIEYYWRSPIKKLRSSGWIRRTSFGLAFVGEKRISETANFMWELTDRGKLEAQKAQQRIAEYRAEVAEATREWKATNIRA